MCTSFPESLFAVEAGTVLLSVILFGSMNSYLGKKKIS